MEYITKYDSPNIDRKANSPRYVVIHHWGADGQTFDGVRSWLCNPRAGVSAHYVVGGKKCACIVNESDAAWHCGNSWYNHHSIGIECRPEMDATTYQTVIETVAMIYKHQGKVLPVIGHKDIVNTACPGRYYKKLADIKRKAEKLYKESQKAANKTPKKTTKEEKVKAVKVNKKERSIDRTYQVIKADPVRVKPDYRTKLIKTLPVGTTVRATKIKGYYIYVPALKGWTIWMSARGVKYVKLVKNNDSSKKA